MVNDSALAMDLMSAGISELQMTPKVTSYALSIAVCPNNKDEKKNPTNRFAEVKSLQI